MFDGACSELLAANALTASDVYEGDESAPGQALKFRSHLLYPSSEASKEGQRRINDSVRLI